MNTSRSKVYDLFTGEIEKLKPVASDGELNLNHWLYVIYHKYISAPTATDEEASADAWLDRIFQFENAIENDNTLPNPRPSWLNTVPGVDSNKVLTADDLSDYVYRRSLYPSSVNLIAESVVSPVELSASADRTPAIFYRIGSVRPHASNQTNTKTESISLIIYAIVLDRSKIGDIGEVAYPHRTLFKATGALTDAMYNAISDVKSDAPAEYGNIEVEFLSRPLREGTGTGEIIRFDIQITYDYYLI